LLGRPPTERPPLSALREEATALAGKIDAVVTALADAQGQKTGERC
jgi:hypothetical protein